ncbi:MAG: hypothetical protein AAFQ58_19305 [Pseudomonadota bacterium]
MDDIAAALEHARLVRTHLENVRKDARTTDAREMAIELVEVLEKLVRPSS